ncbi:MAG: hypothetical protein MK082_08025 [Phycisphaerales bacterium]|nr:hypothetical protein [Phycisphaerales bacterium]
MTRTYLTRIRYRYGRLFSAVALLTGGLAIGLTAQPRGVSATDIEVNATVPTTPEQVTVDTTFHSVMRFGQVYVIFRHHPTEERSCWSVHDLDGTILGIHADRQAVEAFFPEVDTAELMFAAIRNLRETDTTN